MNKILKLSPETARKIAAGEVIERPQSVVRELLDNALDAESDRITVTIKQGGLDFIQVTDNGIGISKDDLNLAIEPHTTSKITHIDDLLHLHTLGFRGEALASIAAVAELEIISAVTHGNGARLFSMPALPASIEPYGASKGTTVTVRNLFANFPARKKFLKYPTAEAIACKQIFIEKAIPFHDIEFVFTNEASTIMLGKETRIKRVHNLFFSDIPCESTAEIPILGNGFQGSIITVSPSFSRKDRRLLQVFVNNRKIQEFSLIQALEYAFRDQLPGGVFPCAVLMLNVNSSLVDFNVHPAKKEARIKNITDIRTGIISAVKHYLKSLLGISSNLFVKNTDDDSNELFHEHRFIGNNAIPAYKQFGTSSANNYAAEHSHINLYTMQQNKGSPTAVYHIKDARETADFTALRMLVQKNRLQSNNEHIEQFRNRVMNSATMAVHDNLQGKTAEINQETEVQNTFSPDNEKFIYYGQFLLTFLIFEKDSSLYILDQHATHERILYNKMLSANTASQELFIPYTYMAKSEDEDYLLASLKEKLAQIHITLEHENQIWQITRAPAFLPDEALGNIFSELLEKSDADAVIKHTLAAIACRSAVKEGDVLDDASACQLIREALALEDPHCPHGRPLWIAITQKELFSRIGRTV